MDKIKVGRGNRLIVFQATMTQRYAREAWFDIPVDGQIIKKRLPLARITYILRPDPAQRGIITPLSEESIDTLNSWVSSQKLMKYQAPFWLCKREQLPKWHAKKQLNVPFQHNMRTDT